MPSVNDLKRLGASFLLLAGAAIAQTTNYPTSLDNDASLFVVSDNIQTSLTVAMATTDTVAIVQSTTGFVPNMLVTICDTVTNTGKCTRWEHMFVTAATGNQLTVTRGYAGTSPLTHNSGVLVSALIDAAHQTSLKKAVIAVETMLGPNGSNMGQLPFLNSSAYSFGPIASGSGVSVAGGSLVNGTNVLTFATVPPGVNGTDSGHYLYFSGGSGGPQACQITGGSGLAGQPNGQIIVNCPGAQSGSWAVQSASGGIAEALSALPANGGGIFIQCGAQITLYQTLYIAKNLALVGCGAASTVKLASSFTGTWSIYAGTAGTTLSVDNVLFDGNRSAGLAANSGFLYTLGIPVIVRNSIFQNINSSAVINLQSAVNSIVQNNRLLNNLAIGINVQHPSYTVTGNKVIGNSIVPSLIAITSCANSTPVVCTISGGVSMQANQDITIRNASVNALNAQWQLTPVGTGPIYTQFSLNGSTASGASTGGTFTEGNMGIIMQRQGGCVVGQNYIFGGSNESIELLGSQVCSVIQNVSHFDGDSGITMTFGSSYNTVADNVFNSPAGYGILCSDPANGQPGQNLFEGNQLLSSGSGYGTTQNASIFGGTGNILRGGRITGATGYGINVTAASNTHIESVESGGNTSGPLTHDGTDVGTLIVDNAGVYSYAIITSHLTAFANGSHVYCYDCTPTCSAGSSTGQMCTLINGAWAH